MSRRCTCGTSQSAGGRLSRQRVFGSECPGSVVICGSLPRLSTFPGQVCLIGLLPLFRQIQALGSTFLQGSCRVPSFRILTLWSSPIKAGWDSTSYVGPRMLLSQRGRNWAVHSFTGNIRPLQFQHAFQEQISQIKKQLILLALFNLKLTSVYYHMHGNCLITRFHEADIY